MILKESLLEKTLDKALSGGADFAEVFVEDSYSSTLSFLDQKADRLNVGKIKGAGIRLFYGEEIIYVTTNDLSEDGLISAAHVASRAIKGAAETKLIPLQSQSYQQFSSSEISPWDFKKEDKISLMSRADKMARILSSDVTQFTAVSSESVQKVQIANSLGRLSEEERNYTRFSVSSIIERAGNKHSGSAKSGYLKGSELLNQLDVESLAREATREASTMVEAGYAPAGEFPVILDKGFGGVIFHEACGHGLETTSVAKNASVFCGKLGEKIAQDCVTAIDDGTIPNEWGSIAIDDEGYPTQKTVLIDKGVLKSYIVDQMGAIKTGYKATGSGRRQNYTFAPASRMRNTYIAPGQDSMQDLLKKLGTGIYCRKMGGGSVMPGTGAFNFAANEAYWVEDGEVKQPLKGASLIGTGIETLGKISAVGKDFELESGICGSVSGSVPTTVGQPPILISNINVGGRA